MRQICHTSECRIYAGCDKQSPAIMIKVCACSVLSPVKIEPDSIFNCAQQMYKLPVISVHNVLKRSMLSRVLVQGNADANDLIRFKRVT